MLYRAQTSDLKILIADVSSLSNLEESISTTIISPSLPNISKHLLRLTEDSDSNWCDGAIEVFRPDDTLVVMNKVDLVESSEHINTLDRELLRRQCEGAKVCHMSCKTGEGVDHFMRELELKLKKMCVVGCGMKSCCVCVVRI